MKSLSYLIATVIIIHFAPVCGAQQNCNPDPNKLITGVPYCEDLNYDTTATTNPDEINNAITPENDTEVNSPSTIYFQPQIYPYMPGPRPHNLYQPNNQYIVPSTPYGGNYQLLPNTTRPVEIPRPHSGTFRAY